MSPEIILSPESVNKQTESIASESNNKARAIKILAVACWSLWGAYSLYLLSATPSPLITAYIAYIVICIAIIATQRDILAPASVITIMSFMAFGSNIPFIAGGLMDGIKIGIETLTKVTWVINIVVVSFATGAILWPKFLIPRLFKPLSNSAQPRQASVTTFLVVAAFILAAGMLRLEFHLGEAGVQPKIGFAGYFQFILYEGSLMLALWFLVQGLKKNKLVVMLGLGLLISIAVIQALLSWRGTIFQMIILGGSIFWYQSLGSKKKATSITWLIILAIVAGNIAQLGNAVRAERLGGEKEFAKSSSGFIERIIERSQGTSRLAGVLEHFGDLTWDNNWLILELVEKGVTTTGYIDAKVYHVAKSQSHSVGTSGPGGVYTALGLMGVVLSYFLLGSFYRIAYTNMLNFGHTNPMGVVLYAYLMLTVMLTLSENFNLLTLKGIIAVIAQVYLLDRFVLRTGSRGEQNNNDRPLTITPSSTPTQQTLFNV